MNKQLKTNKKTESTVPIPEDTKRYAIGGNENTNMLNIHPATYTKEGISEEVTKKLDLMKKGEVLYVSAAGYPDESSTTDFEKAVNKKAKTINKTINKSDSDQRKCDYYVGCYVAHFERMQEGTSGQRASQKIFYERLKKI